MQRRSLLTAMGGLLAGSLRTDITAKAVSTPESRFIAWPVVAEMPPGVPKLNGHTDTVPDIVGRIGANDFVVFTEGNHFPVLFGGEVMQLFRDWAKADRRFAGLRPEDIAVVTLPQPIIVAMLLQGALNLGNATIEVSPRSGFYPDIVMAGENPLRDLRRNGFVRAQARLFARNRGLGAAGPPRQPARRRFGRGSAKPAGSHRHGFGHRARRARPIHPGVGSLDGRIGHQTHACAGGRDIRGQARNPAS